MPDYSQTKIYKLCCNDLDVTEIYVGSTCNFNRRKTAHKSICHNETSKSYNFKVYKYIREHGGFDNWSMILVDEANLENKLQKGKLEHEWTVKLKASLNINVPGRTIKEYYQVNKETLTKKQKEYYEANKETITEKSKQKFDCECGGKYTHINTIRHAKSKKHQSYISSLSSGQHDPVSPLLSV